MATFWRVSAPGSRSVTHDAVSWLLNSEYGARLQWSMATGDGRRRKAAPAPTTPGAPRRVVSL